MAEAAPTVYVTDSLDKHPVCFPSTITTLIHVRPSPPPPKGFVALPSAMSRKPSSVCHRALPPTDVVADGAHTID